MHYHTVLNYLLLHLFLVQFISVPLCYERIHVMYLIKLKNELPVG